jgi:nucleotide-binding universal stress UspA family protein
MYWLPRKTVLVPTNFSRASLDAVHTALAMVEAGRDVHVLHVVEPLPEDLEGIDFLDGLSTDVSAAGRLVHGQQQLAGFIDDHDLDGVTQAVEMGDPALKITGYARSHHVDLIIMAAHGYESGERISLGSVTERALHNADCPMLVLRPDGRTNETPEAHSIRESNGFCAVEGPMKVAIKSR